MHFGKKHVHLTTCEKFINSYVAFVNSEFEAKEHVFFLLNNNKKYPVTAHNVYYLSSFFSYIKLVLLLCFSQKVFFHSFSGFKALLFPFILRFILKKSYWLVWGADLYAYNKKCNSYPSKIKEAIRRSVFKNIGHVVSYIEGDLDLAVEWYQNKSQRHNCICYQSNVFQPLTLPQNNQEEVTVLVGNSADKTNNHSEIFDQIKNIQNIKVVAPLSYGDETYAEGVIAQGRKCFGDNFFALNDFMPFEDYLSLLSTVDIAIFHHNRQQAMGNIITLLGLGKKVYVNKQSTSYSALKDLNLKIFQLERFDTEKLSKEEVNHNISITESEFSYDKLVSQWRRIFNGDLA